MSHCTDQKLFLLVFRYIFTNRKIFQEKLLVRVVLGALRPLESCEPTHVCLSCFLYDVGDPHDQGSLLHNSGKRSTFVERVLRNDFN